MKLISTIASDGLIESGDSWLGDVPANWTRSRIRNVARLSPSYSGPAPTLKDACTFVPMESVSEDGSLDVSVTELFEDIQSGLTLFEVGDVIFAKITPCMENGKGALVRSLPTRYAFGSTEFHVLRPSPKVDGGFLYHATFNPVFRAYAAENMTGAAGQKRVSSRFLKDTRLFLPHITEQRRIAAFLDESCAAIDAALIAKRKQIDTLEVLRGSILLQAVTEGIHQPVKMHETGTIVLPRIPVGWRLTRLKRVAEVRYGLGQPPIQLDSGVAMIRATDIDAGNIRPDSLMYVDPQDVPPDRNAYLKAGEIIVVRSGAYTGDSAIVPPELAGCVAGYDMVVSVERASNRFVAYALLSQYVLNGQIFLLTLRAAQPHLNAEELGSVALALPQSCKEQEEIADFLDTKLDEIRKVSFGIERQIETLLAYRTSLIHECVTGKRRVIEREASRVPAYA